MELYKYFNAEVGLKVLETGLIRFSPARAFNDPFEMKPNIIGLAPSDQLDESMREKNPDVIKDEYEKSHVCIKSAMPFEEYLRFRTEPIPGIQAGVTTSAQWLSPFLRMALEERIEMSIGVLCLTDSDRNLTMWAHYADSHKGVVIGFDTSHAFFSSNDAGSGQPCHLKEVTYCDRPKLTFSGLRAEDIFLTKGEDWSRENEWRMFAGLSAGKVEVTKEGEEIHLFAYPHESVTKIIVGCRASSEVSDGVCKARTSIPGLSRAVVLKASPDRNNYELNFEAIVPV
ncbi:MAG: DUF2971 domain-containing protein [Sulfuritalea sp.]|nr:DUF2971 domain-containing protein [Sulfuritalea sp.]